MKDGRNTGNYAARLNIMIDEYRYKELDAFLVLKDILAKVWKSRKDKLQKPKKKST